MVEETSLDAFREFDHTQKGLCRQQMVSNAIEAIEPATDQEITAYLGYTDPNKTRPRRVELVKAGEVMWVGTRPCKVTGRSAKVWALTSTVDEIQAGKRESWPDLLPPDEGLFCSTLRTTHYFDPEPAETRRRLKEIEESLGHVGRPLVHDDAVFLLHIAEERKFRLSRAGLFR